ncbi:MAG: hypothetical protein K0R78_1984 [Pelosinus sp.]|jgi:hypothetical protein|nr:hypothetical protein [Pelosinus sp.]
MWFILAVSNSIVNEDKGKSTTYFKFYFREIMKQLLQIVTR